MKLAPSAGFSNELRSPEPQASSALVGVVDHGARRSLANRHIERVEHQLGAQVGGVRAQRGREVF